MDYKAPRLRLQQIEAPDMAPKPNWETKLRLKDGGVILFH